MSRIKYILFIILTCFLLPFVSLSAKSINEYVSEIPGIGLIADEIHFDGITLKNLKFEGFNDDDDSILIASKYVITKPGEEHTVIVDYELDSEVLDNFELHHFLYGLHNDGPQGCFLHSLGLKDRKGTAVFTITAPEKQGVYQLRFSHVEGYANFDGIKDKWWKPGKASSKTIMGIVVVSKK